MMAISGRAGCSPANGISPPGMASTYKLSTASMAEGEVAQGTSPEVWGPNGNAEVAFSERERAKGGGVAGRQGRRGMPRSSPKVGRRGGVAGPDGTLGYHKCDPGP